jgi:hypothetical protein
VSKGTQGADVQRDATEAICLEGFRPLMRPAVERGQRFPREAEMVRMFPAYFGLLLPLSAIEEQDDAA